MAPGDILISGEPDFLGECGERPVPAKVMADRIEIRVEAYAGYKADERPVSFFLGGKKFAVSEIIDRWYGPDYRYFKVRADDACVYILKYDERNDRWELEFFSARG